jgi:hypothetical protein
MFGRSAMGSSSQLGAAGAALPSTSA